MLIHPLELIMTKAYTDHLQRFLFDGTDVRGEIVSLEQTWRQVQDRHHYPDVIAMRLGELLSAAALLTATLKLDGILSIEVRGAGPVTLLMAESTPGNGDVEQQLRGIARWDEDAELTQEMTLSELLGNGQIVITLDPRNGNRYQGIVALEHDTLAGCLEHYFMQSEQLPTRLWLAADGERSAGLLLQQLPQSDSQDADAWPRISMLADTVTSEELLTLEAEPLLFRLFHEEQTRVFTPAPVAFGCTCSRERFAQALARIAPEELRSIVAEQGHIDTHCHFCNTHYAFSAADVETLIESPDAPSPTVH